MVAGDSFLVVDHIKGLLLVIWLDEVESFNLHKLMLLGVKVVMGSRLGKVTAFWPLIH
jgi:hypothetical protein